ncbi:MAG: ribose 5-phosphate isomerase B [Proteobacteria bacterium]|nr:ribose 5-phosphate isomerase B [Pseudomonadota bacterium]MCP4919426.1 ribose 5-phosphate isomerase B [Pseudomonadota bacterium]
MRIALASDHAGFDLRQAVAAHLASLGHDVLDLGPAEKARCDYPDFAAKVAGAVVGGETELGILCCGTGVGMSMAANKVHGARAAVVSDCFSASATRQHNNANILCLGERVVGIGAALLIVDAFLGADFEGGRHAGRVQKIMDLEG